MDPPSKKRRFHWCTCYGKMEIMETRQPGFLYEKLKTQLDKVGFSLNKLCLASGLNRGHLLHWKTGARRPSDSEIDKIASVPELGIIREQLEAWRAIEIYGMENLIAYYDELKRLNPEKIERAVQARKQAIGE